MSRLTVTGNKLVKIFYWFNRQTSNLAMIVLMAMGLLIVADVILRRFFNSPLSWTFEVIEVMLTVVVFFTLAYCAVKRGHIAVDVLTSRLSAKAQAIVDIVACFLGVVLFVFMAYCSILSALQEKTIHRMTGLLQIPIYPFVFVVAFGSILLALVLLIQLIEAVVKVKSK
jgi:TRAP-type C4-dicarboxylate transport system permease small subunit